MQHLIEQKDFYEAVRELREESAVPVPLNICQWEVETKCRFWRIDSLTYEKDFPRQEAFENVVASIDKPQCRLVYYIRGTRTGASLYIGVVEDADKRGEFGINDYATMLSKAFTGNFLGSKLVEDKSVLRELSKNNLRYSTVLGIPSRNKEKEDISFQGVDRLINIMTGVDFHLLVVWEPLEQQAVESFDANVKEIYATLQRISKQSVQISQQDSEQYNKSYQKGTGNNNSKTSGLSKSDTESTGWNNDSGKKSGSTSNNKGTSESITEGASTNESHSTSSGRTSGSSASVTWEEQNKVAAEYIKYIDEELLPRLRQGRAKGMYRTAVYLASELPADLRLLENAVTSIYQGESSTFFPLHVRPLPQSDATRQLVTSFSIFNRLEAQSALLPLCSRPIRDHHVSLGTWLTPMEISILAGLPQKEVPGLELREQVGFGLNINEIPAGQALHLGHMYQEGNKLEHRSVALSRADLDKHIFIAGTTGSGKTTTCHRLLHDAKMPFMVIEPAKTEYRVLHNDPSFSDILLFTIGNEKGVPFRFNPFEFLPEESLSAHVDQLKACFMASFDMEAAIPNLLEEALYKTYETFGWSFRDDSNVFLPNNRQQAWHCGGVYFPTISDYIKVIEKVVNNKKFDQRLQNDYIGSIRARLDSLRAGVKGLMLDTRLSVKFEDLLDRKVILELEELKSGEDKSFIMGLVLGRLLEALKARHKKQTDFKHITLVEEAHRLLSRPLPGDSPNRKLGVEMFADMLAEVRKYGESLIIVDQIPSKLAPEVLKNTNTKIIHKLFAKDDKEAVGDTMALDEKQRGFLSHLLTGEAIVFSQGWKKPVDIQVQQLPDVDTSKDVPEAEAFAAGWEYWRQHPHIFCPDCPQSWAGTLSREEIRRLESLRVDVLTLLPSMKPSEVEPWLTLRDEIFAFLQDKAESFLRNVLRSAYLNGALPRTERTQQAKERFEKEVLDLEGAATHYIFGDREGVKDALVIGIEFFKPNTQ